MDPRTHSSSHHSSAFTASLSSSVMDYPIEHGRSYHAYSRGCTFEPLSITGLYILTTSSLAYLLPNDDVRL